MGSSTREDAWLRQSDRCAPSHGAPVDSELSAVSEMVMQCFPLRNETGQKREGMGNSRTANRGGRVSKYEKRAVGPDSRKSSAGLRGNFNVTLKGNLRLACQS